MGYVLSLAIAWLRATVGTMLGFTAGTDPVRLAIKAQKDLAREYKQHKATIVETWKNLSQEKRRECILRGTKNGVESILLDRNDSRLGTVRYIVPEMNLKDLCGADGDGGEYLLSLLESRTSEPAWDAAYEDANLIRDSMINHGLSYPGADKDAYFQLGDEESYGFAFVVTRIAPREVKDSLDKHVYEGNLLSQVHGLLVLQRQQGIYLGLSVFIYDIMEVAEEQKIAGSGEKGTAAGMKGKSKRKKTKKRKTKN